MRIYIDSDYMCHATEAAGLRPFDVPFFDGKCPAFIESFRFVPAGESWTRKDGKVFLGEMASAAYDFDVVEKAQRQYDADEAAHLAELGALIEEIYSEDLEVIG